MQHNFSQTLYFWAFQDIKTLILVLNELTKLLSSFLHSFGHHTDVYVDEYITETEHYTTTIAAQFVENIQKEYMQASKKVN